MGEDETVRTRALRAVASLAALSLVLAACAPDEEEVDTEPVEEEPDEEPDDVDDDVDEADEAAEPTGDPIEFAAVVDQTGDNAVLGELQEAAIEMAVGDVNEAGGVLGRPLEVIFEDAGDEASTGVAATQRALARDPAAILGHQYSFQVFPLLDVIEDAQVPFLHGAQTLELDLDKDGNEWMFRVRTNDELSARSLVELATEEIGAERPAIHHGTDPVSVGFREQAEALLEEIGMEPVVTESHDLGDTDMTAQIRSIVAEEPDVVFVQTFVSESATIARQHEELGLDAPVLWGPATLFAVDFELIEAELLDGDYMSLDAVPEHSEDPVEVEWAERFRSEYDLSPNEIASSWYAAVLMLADGIERADTTDPEPLRDALAESDVSEFNGVPLPGFELSCDERRNCYNKRELVQIVDGQIEPVLTYEAQ